MANLLWRKDDFSERQTEISCSLDQLRNKGYWASIFLEGNGIVFTENTGSKSDEDIFADILACFNWVEVHRAESNDSNEELAKLEDSTTLNKCIVSVSPKTPFFCQQAT